MAIQDLSPKQETIVFGNDSVVVPKYISGIAGGRVLDVKGFPLDVVSAGHVIVQDSASGDYKPLAVQTADNGKTYTYKAKSGTENYVGILYRSVPTSNPAASIMTHGQVNVKALSIALPSDFASAMPLIELVKDEEAK